jgi:hypothetical protein
VTFGERRMRNDQYFTFLCDLVWDDVIESTDAENRTFQLLSQLYRTEFYSLIPNDDNRGMDGLDIREDFIDHQGGQQALPFGSCSVLEMLIGLSFRLEFETSQSKWEKTPTEWFWILINNLNLDFPSNNYLSEDEYQEKIVDIVTIFLERKYKNNGEGGLFPLKNPKNNQKKIEVWYQMSAYILENYPI